jgi:diketogulonate reductase-like aldo/keto reductase
MKTVTLPDGQLLPALGQGTWRMGESRTTRAVEIAALQLGLDLGLTLVDTAEMYGEGGAEKMVGQAIGGRRDEVFLVSKVYPHNASRQGTIAACERSLQRLDCERIDLYLLHWRGMHPLADTVAAFEQLKAQGKIGHWGVSNFGVQDMQELWTVEGGTRCAVNQVYYSASTRGVEFDLMPWLRERGLPLMAYSPVDQGALAAEPVFARIGRRHGASAAQAALAWVLGRPGVAAIPKAVHPDHVRENRAAADLVLTAEDLAEVDACFPPPDAAQGLAVT